MKLTKAKVWEPARDDYRIDRTLNSGEVQKYFYSHIFSSRDQAQKFIDERGPSYRGKLKIVKVHRKAGWAYTGSIRF
jgi:hypothetical protein